MSILEIFRSREKKANSAAIARERLQIIVAHERNGQHTTPDYLPAMKQDILNVVRKYVQVEQDHVSITFENQQDVSILELNVTLPDND
ncbi:cell division topological specificity factor MinE [Sansalvadorimonas verongulae]|uniref:cell division topological specificity factor MinE n=1 Tax=Sansalvadorimonas verongulae TaxID=2172824 RepID=UPI002E3342BB|nr:cell division topological specificity factor MinE [Sansalvadorimonas verongulae]MTI12222.1 cell division topological specificity factor MinE [Sansalvadorimonas verongulae]